MGGVFKEAFIVANLSCVPEPAFILQISVERAFEKASGRENAPIPSDRSGNGAPGPPLQGSRWERGEGEEGGEDGEGGG